MLRVMTVVQTKFVSRSISLPSQSDQIVNLMLGYEQGPLSTRLALNYKSAYLLEMGSDILKAEQDRIVDAQNNSTFRWPIRSTSVCS